MGRQAVKRCAKMCAWTYRARGAAILRVELPTTGPHITIPSVTVPASVVVFIPPPEIRGAAAVAAVMVAAAIITLART